MDATKYETDPELLKLLELSKARVAKMTPGEREAMHKAQRESWARANVATGDPRFD